MKVLMVEPGKVPYETELANGLEAKQAAVGGNIEAVYPFEEMVAIICNEEGKNMGLPLNRALYGHSGELYDIIAGNFFLVGLGDEDFIDLSPELMEKFKERFKHPEKFVRIAGEIVVVKQTIHTEDKDAVKPSHNPEL